MGPKSLASTRRPPYVPNRAPPKFQITSPRCRLGNNARLPNRRGENHMKTRIAAALIIATITAGQTKAQPSQKQQPKPRTAWITQAGKYWHVIICDTPTLRHQGLHNWPQASKWGAVLIWKTHIRKAHITAVPGPHYAVGGRPANMRIWNGSVPPYPGFPIENAQTGAHELPTTITAPIIIILPGKPENQDNRNYRITEQGPPKPTKSKNY